MCLERLTVQRIRKYLKNQSVGHVKGTQTQLNELPTAEAAKP